MDKTPIYKYPLSCARENDELPQYRASMQSHARCKTAIEAVISEQWNGMGFPEDAAKGVLKEFGPEKVALVLAYTVREREHDTRISGHNQSWARTIPKYSLRPDNSDIRIASHHAKLDVFLDVAQKNIQELEQEKKAERSSTRHPATKRRAAKPVMPPVYQQTFDYAKAHGESSEYNASLDINITCRDAIEKAIQENYGDNRLNSVAAVQAVVRRFGYERMFFVLANSVQQFDYDGRISRQSKEWARAIPFGEDMQRRYFVISKCNPGLLDIFVKTALHEHLLSQPLKRADIKAEATRILEQFRAEQEPNSPNGTHFMAQVSPDFLARANTKDHDRLFAMMPFQSLALTSLNGRKGIYALITKDEDRSKPLILRKLSVRKKLQEPTAAPVPSAKKKRQDQER